MEVADLLRMLALVALPVLAALLQRRLRPRTDDDSSVQPPRD